MGKLFFCSAIYLLAYSAFTQNDVIDSAVLKQRYHQRFSLTNQFEGGDLSRYIYTHITEFYPNITLQKSNKKSASSRSLKYGPLIHSR